MKKILSLAAVMALAVPAAAIAERPAGEPGSKGKGHTKKTLVAKCTVKKAFVVRGTANPLPTSTTDRFSGDVTLAEGATGNSHWRKAGAPLSFSGIQNAKFSSEADGTVVKVKGKVATLKKSRKCKSLKADFNDKGYSAITGANVTHVQVSKPETDN